MTKTLMFFSPRVLTYVPFSGEKNVHQKLASTQRFPDQNALASGAAPRMRNHT